MDKKWIVLAGVVGLLAFGQIAWAGGVSNMSGIGPEGKAMGPRIAGAESIVNAFYSNPAQIAKIPSSVEAGVEFIRADFTLESPLGSIDSAPGDYVAPYVGVKCKLGGWNLAMGGIVPNMYGIDFEKSLGFFSEVSLTTPTIVVAREYGRLSIGVAGKVGIGSLNLVTTTMPFSGVTALARSESESDGDDLGYQIGISYQLGNHTRFGLSHQSQIEVDLEGESVTSLSPLGTVVSDDFSTRFTFPGYVAVGIGYESRRFSLGMDVIWFDYSPDQMEIDFEVGPDVVMPMQWEDSMFCGLGVAYRANDFVEVSAGTGYQSQVIPDATVSPATVDMPGWSGSVGFSLDLGNFSLDLSHLQAWGNERDLPGGTSYSSSIGTTSIMIGYSF